MVPPCLIAVEVAVLFSYVDRYNDFRSKRCASKDASSHLRLRPTNSRLDKRSTQPHPMSYPAKIRAVGINETGGVEVIQNLEVPFPEVKTTDLLIKVFSVTSSSSFVLSFILSGRVGWCQLC